MKKATFLLSFSSALCALTFFNVRSMSLKKSVQDLSKSFDVVSQLLNASAKSSDRGESRRGKAHTKKSDASSKKIGELLKPGEIIEMVEVSFKLTKRQREAIEIYLECIAKKMDIRMRKKELPQQITLGFFFNYDPKLTVYKALNEIKNYFLAIKKSAFDDMFGMVIDGNGNELVLNEKDQKILGKFYIATNPGKEKLSPSSTNKKFEFRKIIEKKSTVVTIGEFPTDAIVPTSNYFNNTLLKCEWGFPIIEYLELKFHITKGSARRMVTYLLRGNGEILQQVAPDIVSF